MTNPLWSAEREVDEALAARLIGEQFPQLEPVRISALGIGWDNSVFRVNEQYAFRFPRRAVAVPLIDTEARVLGALAPHLPLPIPVPVFTGQRSANYPWPFVGHTHVQGAIAAHASLTLQQRHAMVRPLAEFLRALHGIPLEVAEQFALVDDQIDRLNSRRRATVTHERLATLEAHGIVLERDFINRILDAPLDFSPRRTVIAHGDLHAAQMLVDAHGTLCGVIDWGDVHVGDPGTDLACVHAMLPADAHAEFLRHYGAVDASRWQAARMRATWHCVALAAYAHDKGDLLLLNEARAGLAFIHNGL